jgi:iron complex outermembrane receptor protein
MGNPGVFPFGTASVGGDRQDLSEDSVDGQVALNWTVNDQHFLYGLISRGHITGGVNLFPPFDKYDEMQVINYETGWKANWADDRFRTQFTVYYESFKDYQANFADSAVGGINNPTNRNAETTSHLWGLELSGQARFGGFSLDFGAAYLDSKLGTFQDVVDPFRTPPDNVVNLSGAEVPFAPNFTGNIGLSYAIPIGDMSLTPRVDVAYSGETQAALWDSPMVTLESRTLVNGLLTLAPNSDRWSAELWVTNASDKHYIAGIQNNATLYYAAPPRQYGFRAKFNF